MRKLLLLSALALLLASFPAAPAEASNWSFLTYHTPGSWAMCTGEAGGSGASFCDVTTSWGSRIRTSEYGGDCVASIWCGGLVKSCLASTTWGGWKPAICYATTSNGGEHKAVCKSDVYGAHALRCD